MTGWKLSTNLLISLTTQKVPFDDQTVEESIRLLIFPLFKISFLHNSKLLYDMDKNWRTYSSCVQSVLYLSRSVLLCPIMFIHRLGKAYISTTNISAA